MFKKFTLTINRTKNIKKLSYYYISYVPKLVQVDIHCREEGIMSLLRKMTHMKRHSCQNILELDIMYFVYEV